MSPVAIVPVLTAAVFKIKSLEMSSSVPGQIFTDVSPWITYICEEGGVVILRNVGNYLPYTAIHMILIHKVT
jgi:hypothetical protein